MKCCVLLRGAMPGAVVWRCAVVVVAHSVLCLCGKSGVLFHRDVVGVVYVVACFTYYVCCVLL